MKKVKLVYLALFFVGLVACSDSDDSGDSSISNQTLQGTVFGTDFTAIGGKAFDTSFGDIEQVSINITNAVADCDSSIFDYNLYVSTSIAFEVGTYDDSNVVFHSGDETPLNVLQSTVIIEEITDTTITVKIASESFDGESVVDGTFTVNYCN